MSSGSRVIFSDRGKGPGVKRAVVKRRQPAVPRVATTHKGTEARSGASSAATAHVIENTREQAATLLDLHQEVTECAKQHGLVLSTLQDSTLQVADAADRIQLLQRMKVELAKAHRPLIGANIYQKELAATLEFAGGADPRTVAASELHEISMQYELDYMRQPNSAAGERVCRAGKKCDAVRIAVEFGMKPWKMREFLFPDQHAKFAEARELPIRAQLCVFCLKKNAYMNYGMLIFQHQDARLIVQPYRNKCDVEGEFSSYVCMKPRSDRFYGIIAPFARHDMNMYTMEIDKTTGLQFAAYTDVVYFRAAPTVQDSCLRCEA